jgi:hypothetical protein
MKMTKNERVVCMILLNECHSRGGGNPFLFNSILDSRLRGNDKYREKLQKEKPQNQKR